ncbi:hypothetical protein D1007_24976 [Hordeum vulgare]|nr:hypothetical protein D1007_24976 [Hordeum vulgare]
MEHIEFLRHHRKLLSCGARHCVPPRGGEFPGPKAGEVVVLVEHFARGFELPPSNFFFSSLMHFGLQPHHLAANTVLQLAAYVTHYEGFLGIEPRLDISRQLSYFKQQSLTDGDTVNKRMTACGTALVHHRAGSNFLKLPLQDSVKKWKRGFFYMKNVNPQDGHINLPLFINTPPTEKLNWQSDLPHPASKVKLIYTPLELLKVEGLTATDLLATMVAHRILPLQCGPHLICQISTRHERCQRATKEQRASKLVGRGIGSPPLRWRKCWMGVGRVTLRPGLLDPKGKPHADLDFPCQLCRVLIPDAGSRLRRQLLGRLQVYRRSADDILMLDPDEIEDVDEV